MVYTMQACNDEKEEIKDTFIAVRQDLVLLQGQICSDQARIKGDVSGNRGQVTIQQAIINEMRVGIMILQGQDNVVVQETGEILQAMYKQVAEEIKKQTSNGSTFLTHRKAIIDLIDTLEAMQK